MTFASDGTYRAEMEFDGTQIISYPSSCLGGGQCPVAPAPNAGVTGSCGEVSPGQCRCEFVYDHFSLRFAGTYTTADGTLTTVEPGSDPEPLEYCVEGNTLRLHTNEASGGTTQTIVLTRQ